MSEKWQPLLVGSDQSAAREVIASVTAAAQHRLRKGAATGLASGHAGLLLMEQYTGPERPDVATIASLLRAIEHERLGPGLYAGIAGVGWALAHVLGIATTSRSSSGQLIKAAAVDEYEELAMAMLDEPRLADEVLLEVDEALTGFLRASRAPFEVDLISGTVGIGVYALERMRTGRAEELLEAVVDQLAQAAEISGERARWFTPIEILHRRQADHRVGYYDLGVAHGLPGMISILSSASAVGVRGQLAAETLTCAVNELLERAKADPSPSRLPSYVYSDGISPSARLAWCYGDTGAAAVLLHAGQACDRPEWTAAALDLASTSSVPGIASAPPEKTGVVDACLCHGSAGVAHALNRMYQRTGEETLRQASIDWFRRTIDLGKHPMRGVGGYSVLYPTKDGEEWRDEAGFLEGACGIALALAAAVSATPPAWDSALGLSSPATTLSQVRNTGRRTPGDAR